MSQQILIDALKTIGYKTEDGLPYHSDTFMCRCANEALQQYSAEPGNVEGDGQDELWNEAFKILFVDNNVDKFKSQFHISKK